MIIARLNDAQIEHINRTHTCAICTKGYLLEGPWGGGSVNVKCDNPGCRQEYWFCMDFGKLVAGGLLSRDDESLYRANHIAFG